MPATSSAPGSQPQSVATRNAKTTAKVIKATTKSVARSAGKAVSTGVAVGSVAASAGQAVSTGVAHPEASSYAAAKAAQRAQRVARAKQRTVKRAIRNDPPKAEKLVQASTKKIWESLDVKGKGPAPQIKLSADTKAVKAPKPTVTVSQQDARKFFSPAPKIRKATRRTVVKEAVKAQAKAPTRPERRQAKTELKTAAKKAKPGLLSKLDREFAPGETITPHQAAVLAESQGLPGKTYAQIAKGESALAPAAESSDGGHGLWQMTPRVQSAETVAKWDKIAAKHPGGYHNPVVAAKQAKYLAGDSTGTSNYYGTGFVTDPDAHTRGGPAKAQQQLRGKPKPIPEKVKAKAKEVLGPAKTKQIVKKAQTPKAVSSAPKKLKGPLGGSREMVRQIVGSKVKGDHGYENEGSVHSASGDHYGPGSYAQDINQPAGNAAEGEPAYNQATLDKIVKNLRAQGADVPALKIGENWEGSVKGYAIQLLTNEGGTVNHIHIGAHWEGTPTTAGTASGYAASAVSAGSAVPSATQIAATAIGAHKKGKRKAKRLDGKARSQLLRKIIAEGPAAAEDVVGASPATSATPAPRKVTVNL